MSTYFKIEYIGGEPTDEDYARVAELASQGYTEGQLINEDEE